ncbi:MAG: hypothetical protein ABW199_12280, partial [Caulobacterales bacterium]
MSEPVYRRGQIEWALWRLALGGLANPRKAMPQLFRTRVKKLLDLDHVLPRGRARADKGFAFSSARPAGLGTDAAFTRLDTLCLAIGLDLLDLGFKQMEIVELVRALRAALADALSDLFQIAAHETPNSKQLSPNRPPAKQSGKFRIDAPSDEDVEIFLIVPSVERPALYTDRIARALS